MSKNPHESLKVTAPDASDHRSKDSSKGLTTQSSFAWWESGRLLYNTGLVVAGIAAFICYVVVCFTLLPRVLPPSQIKVTPFTTLFQGVGYLFMMGFANVCYFLGPLSECLIRPLNVEQYRQICYRLGFWFSVLLPFSIPVLLTVLVLFFPDSWKR
jgi:MFS family permease